MTEREKTIEEKIIEKDIKVEQLAREVFCKYPEDELSCEDCTFPIIQCVPRIWARKIINADYLKAEEVRKEMAKKLYEWLKSFIWYGYDDVDEEKPYFVSKVDSYSIKSFIRKEFGVEVEE